MLQAQHLLREQLLVFRDQLGDEALQIVGSLLEAAKKLGRVTSFVDDEAVELLGED